MIIYLNMLETDEDREIFAKLYEDAKPMLWHVARKIVRNEADAEDAIHTCFLHLAENFGKYKGQSYENLIKLCNVISKNAATDIARDYGKVGDVLEEDIFWDDNVVDPSPGVLDKLIERYESELLDRAVKRLSPLERELLFVRYVLGFKPMKIARMYRMDYEVVKKKLRNSKYRLAKILEEKEYEGLR